MSQLLEKYRQKKTQMADMRSQDKSVPFSSGNSDRAEYLSIDDGENRFRIFPAHLEGGGSTFTEPKSVHWLTVNVDEYNEKNEKTGETVQKRKPVFNTIVHGNPAIGRDIIEEYIEFAKERLAEMYDKKSEREEAINTMYDWKVGIHAKASWVMYAYKFVQNKPIFGILEISNGVKKKINELITTLDTPDTPLVTDPLSDIDDGICIVIKKSGVNLKTTYAIEFHSERKGKFNVEMLPTPLTMDDIAILERYDSLHKMFNNVYSTRHFEMQLDGLRHFDEEVTGWNFMEDPAFIDKMEEINDLVQKYAKKVRSEDDQDESQKEESSESQEKLKTSSKAIKEAPQSDNSSEDGENNTEDQEQDQKQPEKALTPQERLALLKAKRTK
jgi:hypothetical protein